MTTTRLGETIQTIKPNVELTKTLQVVIGNYTPDNNSSFLSPLVLSESFGTWSPHIVNNIRSTVDGRTLPTALQECVINGLKPFPFSIKEKSDNYQVVISTTPSDWVNYMVLYKLIGAHAVNHQPTAHPKLENGINGFVTFKQEFISTLTEDELLAIIDECARSLTAVRNGVTYSIHDMQSVTSRDFYLFATPEDAIMLHNYMDSTGLLKINKHYGVVDTWLCMVRARQSKVLSEKTGEMSGKSRK